jgi:hypothetical protein
MKKLVLSATVICVLSLLVGGKNSDVSAGLPTLHVIKTVVLSPSYSCKPAEEIKNGYQGSALYLSDFSKDQGSPDLLFNGSCLAADYFEAAIAGDDMSLIADLGTGVSLEDVSALRAFNLQHAHSYPAYSKFASAAKLELNHTYAVLLNNHVKRGLFVFTVTEHTPNKQVTLKYAVKSYEVIRSSPAESSPGFDWNKKSLAQADERGAD